MEKLTAYFPNISEEQIGNAENEPMVKDVKELSNSQLITITDNNNEYKTVFRIEVPKL